MSNILRIVNSIPEAKEVLEEYQDNDDFLQWITEDKDYLRSDIATAIHETIHGLRVKKNKFKTIKNFYLPTDENNDKNLPEPRNVILPILKRQYTEAYSNHITEVYLSGNDNEVSSSAHFFSYLLDELNAYGFDLYVFLRLENLQINSNPRDGLAAFMAYSAIYAAETKIDQYTDQQKANLGTLWKQSEMVMGEAIKVDNIGMDDEIFLRIADKYRYGLEKFIGRPGYSFI